MILESFINHLRDLAEKNPEILKQEIVVHGFGEADVSGIDKIELDDDGIILWLKW